MCILFGVQGKENALFSAVSCLWKFQAMVFIALLLFTFAYIFSIIGVMFLQEGYTKESVTSLNYPKSFR